MQALRESFLAIVEIIGHIVTHKLDEKEAKRPHGTIIINHPTTHPVHHPTPSPAHEKYRGVTVRFKIDQGAHHPPGQAHWEPTPVELGQYTPVSATDVYEMHVERRGSNVKVHAVECRAYHDQSDSEPFAVFSRQDPMVAETGFMVAGIICYMTHPDLSD